MCFSADKGGISVTKTHGDLVANSTVYAKKRDFRRREMSCRELEGTGLGGYLSPRGWFPRAEENIDAGWGREGAYIRPSWTGTHLRLWVHLWVSVVRPWGILFSIRKVQTCVSCRLHRSLFRSKCLLIAAGVFFLRSKYCNVMKCEAYEYVTQRSSGMSAKCLSSFCPFSQSARLKLACVSSLALMQAGCSAVAQLSASCETELVWSRLPFFVFIITYLFWVYELWRSRKNDASVARYMLASEGTGSVYVAETLCKYIILYTKCQKNVSPQ